ncbi:MAG TPA: TetR/AcrR family transcriptional regulator [Actinotalea sp.]|nr:TetR/AcrR family transcriptional regulator [Actinotalea sp.]
MSTPPRSRTVLSRDQIVSAATALVDEQGVEALTMRAVAARLGSGVMSLYRHAPGREELLDLVLAEMTAALPVPGRTGDWRADLHAVAATTYAALVRRPQLTVLLTARSGRGAGELPLLDHVLGVLRAAGLTARQAVLVNQALGNLVAGAALWAAVGLGGTSGTERGERLAEARRVAEAAPELENLTWAASELVGGDLDERFGAAVELLLAGVEAWLPPPDRASLEDDTTE